MLLLFSKRLIVIDDSGGEYLIPFSSRLTIACSNNELFINKNNLIYNNLLKLKTVFFDLWPVTSEKNKSLEKSIWLRRCFVTSE